MTDGKTAGLAIGVVVGAIFGGILIACIIEKFCRGAGIFRSFMFVPHLDGGTAPPGPSGNI